MFREPPVVPIYAGLLTTLVAICSIVAPYGWTMLLPPPMSAALWLREASAVWQHEGCASGSVDDWQGIAASPRAAHWFSAIARDAVTPAGRVYALVGLGVVNPAALDSAVAVLTPAMLADTVRVIMSHWQGRRLPLAELLPEIRNGTLARRLADRRPRPEC
jgi:hypothetical protein